MSITKRTRYEVLNRDGFTCQYCGARAPQTELHVDHVIPKALGGDDKPGNLVAACKECNAGKGASNPDSPLVQRLSDEAATYALAMANKVASLVQRLTDEAAYIDHFEQAWLRISDQYGVTPPPHDYRETLRRWHRQGIPVELIDYAIEVASAKPRDNEYRYMAGVIYRMLEQEDVSFTLGEKQVRLYTQDERREALWKGQDHGVRAEAARTRGTDLLARHIDAQARAEVEIYDYMIFDHHVAHLEAA